MRTLAILDSSLALLLTFATLAACSSAPTQEQPRESAAPLKGLPGPIGYGCFTPKPLVESSCATHFRGFMFRNMDPLQPCGTITIASLGGATWAPSPNPRPDSQVSVPDLGDHADLCSYRFETLTLDGYLLTDDYGYLPEEIYAAVSSSLFCSAAGDGNQISYNLPEGLPVCPIQPSGSHPCTPCYPR